MPYTYLRLREKYVLKIDQGQRQGYYLFLTYFVYEKVIVHCSPCDLRRIRYRQVDHMAVLYLVIMYTSVGQCTLSRDNADLGEIVHTFLNDAQVGRCVSVSGQ